jgi:chemotaxis protein CheX
MRAEYINPFVTSLKNTFQTMLGCAAQRGPIQLKTDNRAMHQVSGVIGLSGKAVGVVVLSMSEEVALKSASTLLMMEASKIDADVLDAVGELANVVAGAAKAHLEELDLKASLPSVITGQGHEIHFPSNVKPLSIAFMTDWGPLSLEVGLEPVPEPVAV